MLMRHVRATSAYAGIRAPLVVVLLLVAVVVLPTPARSSDEIAAPPSDLQLARAALEVQVQKHPILEGVTVELSDTLDHQAVAYYTEGRIVISTAHTASIDHIIEHEVWHVIDWRDNGRIDWGESVPPSDSPT
jgi:hypothetical protein